MTIKNLKNVKFADIEFSRYINKISWQNWSWKSTIIDAIRTAILWITYHWRWISAEKLITQWKEECEINIKIWDEKKTIHVRRKINQKWNNYLECVDSDANKLTQWDLTALCSQFTIDPLEFTRKNAKEQFEFIKKVTWCNTEDIDEKIQYYMETRKQSNAVLKSMQSSIWLMWDVVEVEAVDVSDLTQELQRRNEYNEWIRSKGTQIQASKQELMWLEERKKRLLLELEWIETQIERANNHINLLSSWFSSTMLDTEEIMQKLWKADAINKSANEYKRYTSLKDEAEKQKAICDQEDQMIEKLREEKKNMIKSSKMPIDDMEFSETDWVIINWIPFNQYSTAQQLIMATKIASFTNPSLKVIVIKDWSLLDNDSLVEIEKFAEENDYQIYIELVNEQFDTIIMREWEVIEKII